MADKASEESKFSVTKRVITKLYSKYEDNANIAKLIDFVQQLEDDSIDNVESLIGLYALDEVMSLLEDILIWVIHLLIKSLKLCLIKFIKN